MNPLPRIHHRIVRSSKCFGAEIHRFSQSLAFSWLKAFTSTFTFKTLLRHYAEQALTPR